MKIKYIKTVIWNNWFNYKWNKIYDIWEDNDLFLMYYKDDKNNSKCITTTFETLVTNKWFIDELSNKLNSLEKWSKDKVNKWWIVNRQAEAIYWWEEFIVEFIEFILKDFNE